MKLKITLPFVLPSVNHAYKNVSARSKGKAYTRRILTDEARAAMDHATLLIKSQAARQGWRTPERARYRLQIRFYFATDASDGDNAIKLLQDALADALGFNDNKIREWHITKEVDRRNTRSEIELEVI